MGIKTRIAASAVTAVMALSAVPQIAAATNGDSQYANPHAKTNTRLGGLDRQQTATKIADAYNAERVNTVILAVGRDFPDALASTPLSDQLNAPVLLNDGARLNAPTSKWLFDNKPTTIVVVGGAGVIPQSVLDDITAVYKQARAGFEPTFVRYSGTDRNETAYQVSARTVAGYFEAGECTSTGVDVTYTDKQKATVGPLKAADAELAEVQQKLAAYAEAKAKYEAVKAAYDKAVDAEAAALKAYNDAIAALEAITQQLKEVPALEPLIADVEAKGQAIATASAEATRIQGLYNKLTAIETAAIQAGVENTEEHVWENLNETPWYFVKEQLPALAADIDAVVDEFGGTTVLETKNAANTARDNANAAVTAGQAEYAEAVNKLDKALENDAANAALKKQISDAAAKVVAAKEALEAAQKATEEAKEAYDEAAAAYAALVNDPAVVPGALARAQAKVQAALDAVVAAADNVPVFLGTGRVFADSLTAGPAAADQCGVILLTEDDKMSAPTIKWIQNAKPKVVAAVGGPARNAAGASATVKYVGKDRFETAKIVNLRYLSDRNVLGIATGYDFPDALTGAALVANTDGGLLLVRKDEVPQQTVLGVHGGKWNQLLTFGGTGVVSPAVAKQVFDIMDN